MEVIKRTVNTLFGNAAAIKANDPRAVVQFMKMECKGVEVVKAEDGNDIVYIKGYASTPHIDRHNDVVEPSAFAKSLVTFLKNPRLLLRHWDDKNIGNVTEANIIDEGNEETDGLYVKAAVINDIDGVKTLIRNGQLKTLSIGFICNAWEERKMGEGDNVRIVRVITDLDLLEISVVDIPANGNALFTMGKSLSHFFKSVKALEDAESPETQGAPQAAPEAPKEEPTKTDEAGNPGGTPEAAQADAAQAAEGNGVEVPEAGAQASATVDPVVPEAAPAPVEAPADAVATPDELKVEQAAHEATKAALEAAKAEKDAAIAELARVNGELAEAKAAAEVAEKKAKDAQEMASNAQDDAEKAHAVAKALTARARAGKDTARIEAKAQSAQDPLTKACRMITFRA